ncbi:hypothetical protein HN789_00995 [archaeon]|jgi:hypothetical protein|nr:hypothetical protein [archaeon]MBT6040878.1 hypothetical protein [Candidatus Woesearchaeota archaeon]MBT4272718.1 hypothetical protein [archaeon]MBT4461517.1 hypothetical protein [archaeon]MBT4857714.1 hypothetical protein [archaeon]
MKKINVAIRLDDYMLRPEEREQFEAVIALFQERDIPATVSVVSEFLEEEEGEVITKF